MKKFFEKGELVSYKSKRLARKLGIVVSEPYKSKGAWKVKTYCNGSLYSSPVSSVMRVCDDVEILK